MASRQLTAKANSWSLEDIELFLDVANDQLFSSAPYDLSITGLILQGAAFNAVTSSINFSEELHNLLPQSKLKWRLKNQITQPAGDRKTKSYATIHGHALIQLPLYRNDNRKELITSLFMKVSVSHHHGAKDVIPAYQWAQRSVAIVLETSFN